MYSDYESDFAKPIYSNMYNFSKFIDEELSKPKVVHKEKIGCMLSKRKALLQALICSSPLDKSIQKALLKALNEVSSFQECFRMEDIVKILTSGQFIVIDGYVTLNSKSCYEIDENGSKIINSYGIDNNINCFISYNRQLKLKRTNGYTNNISLLILKYVLSNDSNKNVFLRIVNSVVESKNNLQQCENDSIYEAEIRRKASYYFEDLLKVIDTLPPYRPYATTFADDVISLCGEQGINSGSKFEEETFISKNIYSNLDNNRSYIPDRFISISICVALRLDINETNRLLEKAGYVLTPLREFDKFILEKSIVPRYYHISELNDLLEQEFPDKPKYRLGSRERSSYHTKA